MKYFYLVVLLCLSYKPCVGNPLYDRYQFKQLTVKNGLSSNSITCIHRDSRGFMWFGTSEGLNRYDGLNFKVFSPDYRSPYALPSNDVIAVHEDAHNRFWLQFRDRYILFDATSERFYTNIAPFLQPMGLDHIEIERLHIDQHKNFWIYTKSKQLYYVDGKTNEYTTIPLLFRSQSVEKGQIDMASDVSGNLWLISGTGCVAKVDAVSKKNTYIDTSLETPNYQGHNWNIYADKDSDLWLWTAGKGVFRYQISSKSYQHYTSPTLTNNDVINVVQDDDKMVWISLDHGGINLVDKNHQKPITLEHIPDVASSLAGNTAANLYCDHEGIVWVGTFKQGLSYYHKNLLKFPLIQHQSHNPQSLPYNDINCFVEDRLSPTLPNKANEAPNFWIGTNGGGLLHYNQTTKTFKQFRHIPNNTNSISGDIIVDLKIDKVGTLWIGTYLSGLSSYDGKTFKQYKNNKADDTSLGDYNVWHIFEDSKQQLWIGTLWGGLDKMDREHKTFTHIRSQHDNASLTDYVPVITEDMDGDLWFGGYRGVSKLSAKTGLFEDYSRTTDSTNTANMLSNNMIVDIYCDSRGLIWMASNDGLNFYDKKNKIFRTLTVDDGLCSNSIVSILEDDFHNLWITTSNGLSNIIVNKKQDGQYTFVCHNYNENDGLQGRSFNLNAALKLSNGDLLVGGSNGFNIITPQLQQAEINLPNIYFTSLHLFNAPVKVGDLYNNRCILSKNLADLQQIDLQHNENVFSIQITAPNFIAPEKLRYRYQLEGFQVQWLALNQQNNRIDFTNLDAGDYILHISISTNGVDWHVSPNVLHIHISPPIWWSVWAKLFYFTLLVISIYLIIYYYSKQQKAKQLRKELAIENEQKTAFALLKRKFLSNVSHDFRTPLTLIMVPLEILIATYHEANLQKNLLVMYRNAKQLLNLSKQFIEIAEADEHLLQLQLSPNDLILLLKDIAYSFSSLIEKKEIRFTLDTDLTHLQVWFDRDKLERTMYNLLSNAVKFTPEGGRITIKVVVVETKNEEVSLTISIIDSGIGIPKDDLDKIFNRFYQSTQQTAAVGNGIGLSIATEYIKLHGGYISVDSVLGEGSNFTIHLKLALEEQLEMETDTEDTEEDIDSVTEMPTLPEPLVPKISPKILKTKPIVLLIDDDADLRFYLQNQLKDVYTVLEAENGKKGWKRAIESIPDIVVCDVVMPELDGLAFCRKMKLDKRSSHIPIILLTGQNTDEQQLEGLQAGADDYIGKPFHLEVLLNRIGKQIQQRELLQNQFKQSTEPSEVHINSIDDKLIQNIVNLTQQHMADANFNVEELSKQMGMSRVFLYKKLMAITGTSPVEFIRRLRLKRAEQLLKDHSLNVSEVAYQTGFNNPKVFAKYFKIEFGQLPSERKQDRN